MEFHDFSPPAQPSLEQQRDALRKGLGRAMQWALTGQLADEPLLEACLLDQRFDRDVAAARGKWLWQMIQGIGATERFRPAILDVLCGNLDERSAQQLCQLARFYAETGDEPFRTRLYEIVEQKPLPYLPWLGEEELLALDGEAAFVFAARVRGRGLPTRGWEWDDDHLIECTMHRFGEEQINRILSNSPDEALSQFQKSWHQERQRQAARTHGLSHRDRVRAISANEVLAAAESADAEFGLFRGWGMHADQADLELVLQRLWTTESAFSLAKLLQVFSNRSLPQFDARLIDFCRHEDAGVRRRAFRALEANTHPLVRRFAMEQLENTVRDELVVSLFTNNYEPGDEQRIRKSLDLPPDEGALHSLLMDVNKLLEKNPAANCSELATIVYALTPCENCRFFALRLLHNRQVVPEWMQRECRHDSGDDCRQLT